LRASSLANRLPIGAARLDFERAMVLPYLERNIPVAEAALGLEREHTTPESKLLAYQLVHAASNAWSVDTHALLPRYLRVYAVELCRIAYRLRIRFPTIDKVDLMDIWIEHILPCTVQHFSLPRHCGIMLSTPQSAARLLITTFYCEEVEIDEEKRLASHERCRSPYFPLRACRGAQQLGSASQSPAFTAIAPAMEYMFPRGPRSPPA